MPYSTKRDKSGELRVFVNDIESWNGFEEIVKFFENEHDAEVMSKLDGPDDSRVWDLAMKGQIITVVHDDLIGNSFFSKASSAETLVLNLAEHLQQRIDESDT